MNSFFYDRGASLYLLELDDGFDRALNDVKPDYLHNVKNLDVLVRFSVKVST